MSGTSFPDSDNFLDLNRNQSIRVEHMLDRDLEKMRVNTVKYKPQAINDSQVVEELPAQEDMGDSVLMQKDQLNVSDLNQSIMRKLSNVSGAT